MGSWYVVHCKPRSERLALEHLNRQGYVTYLPMLKVYSARKADLTRFEAMFPRYLFCQPHSPEQSIAPIRSTTGVIDIVRFGSKPATLAEALVAQIRCVEAQQHLLSPGGLSGLQSGSFVRVTEGPLTTLEGLVTSVADQRVSVLFELLGSPVNIDLGLSQVRAIL